VPKRRYNDETLRQKALELRSKGLSYREIAGELGCYGVPVHTLRLPDGTHEIPNEESSVVERMKRIPPDENHEFVRGTKWEVEGRGISLVYRRIHPLKPSYTIVAYGGGGTHGYHYDRDRATLTLGERARLQTFPDTFLFSGTKTQIRAQIGEVVPPLAGKRLA
jgi:DNA (cytosine-5)-methyltransferase 1